VFDYSFHLFVYYREYWFTEAAKTRAAFDSNRSLADNGQISTAINKAQNWLIENRHPDPYNPPNQVGGSSFQRNAAPPLGVS